MTTKKLALIRLANATAEHRAAQIALRDLDLAAGGDGFGITFGSDDVAELLERADEADATIEIGEIHPATWMPTGDGLDVRVVVNGHKGNVLVAEDTVNGGYAVHGNAPDTWMSGALLKAIGDDVDLVKRLASEVCATVAGRMAC